MKSPFKFLDAYTLSDQKVFFGREQEINALYKMVFESPLILVYGYMGTGKTSLIKCGLAGKFDGPDWYPLYIRRHHDFNDSLEASLRQVSKAANGAVMTTQERVDFIYKKYLRPVYLIFDQFEELFILGDEEEQLKFIQTIKTLVESEVPCKVILVMREEYLGNLYHFEKQLPYIFDFKLRVEKMGNKKVKKVIFDSFGHFNIMLEEPIDERLDQIVDKVSLGKSGIQLPYLQVYMDLLYREDYARTYPGKERDDLDYPELTFTKSEIESFGTIDQVLEKFLEEQEVKVSGSLLKKYPALGPESIGIILNAFVSDEGTKRPVTYIGAGEHFKPEEEFRNNLPTLSNQQLDDALRLLDKARLIRITDDTIELAHDTLAAIIHSKRSHEELQLKEIRNQLQTHYKTYLETGEVINIKKVIYYENFLEDLNLPKEILDFLEASKAVEDSRKSKERRKWILWIVAMAATSVVSLFFALDSQMRKEQVNLGSENSSLLAKLNEDVSKAFQKTKNDRTIAFNETQKILVNLDTLITKQQEAKNKELEEKDNLTTKLKEWMGWIFDGNIEMNPIADELKKDLIKEVTFFPFYKNKVTTEKNIIKTAAYTIEDSIHYLLSWPKDANYLLQQRLDKDYNPIGEKDKITIQGEINDFVLSKEAQKLYVAYENTIEVWSLENTPVKMHEIKADTKIYSLENWPRSREPLFVGTDFGLCRLNVDRKGKPYFKKMQSFKSAISSITVNDRTGNIAMCEQFSNKVFLINRKKFDSDLKTYPVDTITLEEGAVKALDFSKDGKLLAIAYDNGKAGIYQLSRNRIAYELIGHESVINSITFSPDDQFILTSSQDNKAIVWRKSGEPLKKLIGHDNALFYASYINNEMVLTAGEDDNMKIWNVESLAEQSFLFDSQVTHLSYAPDGKDIIASSKDREGKFIAIIGIENHDHEFEHSHHTEFRFDTLEQPLKYKGDQPGFFRSLFFTSDNHIVMGVSNHLTTIMDFSKREDFTDFRSDRKSGHSQTRIRSVAASDSLVAIGDERSGIIIRKRKGGAYLAKTLDRKKVNAVTFSNDGKKIFAGYTDGFILIYNIESLTVIDTLKGHTGTISSMVVSPKNDLLVSGSYDNTAIVWEIDKDGKYVLKQQLTGHLSDVNAVDISMDSIDLVLTASGDNTAKIWKRNKKGEKWIEEPGFIRHLGGINTAAFDNKGEHVATGSDDKTIKIWNIHNPNEILDKRTYTGGEGGTMNE